jgi:hypothetical protein
MTQERLWNFISAVALVSWRVNHVSARTEMGEIYDRYGYLDEMREAIEKWETFVQTTCVNGPHSVAA